MATKKASWIAGIAVAGLATAGVVAAGANAVAQSPEAATTTVPAAVSAPAQPGGHDHTAVTGDEAQRVIDAVQAAHPGVTIDTVEKDPDGSYDAHGTGTDGAPVKFEVSADFSSISEGMGGGPGGPAGQGDMGRGPGAPDANTNPDNTQTTTNTSTETGTNG